MTVYKMFIPPIGTKIELIQSWTFDVWTDRRNDGLGEYLNLLVEDNYSTGISYMRWPKGDHRKPVSRHTFDIGTKLKIDRIFIKKGISSFDSVTFILEKQDSGWKRNIRFWVKLYDVNTMIFKLMQ